MRQKGNTQTDEILPVMWPLNQEFSGQRTETYGRYTLYQPISDEVGHKEPSIASTIA